MAGRLSVPAVVRARAAVDGDGGAGWADALPGLVSDLEVAWSIRVGEQLAGGSTSVVARARTSTGERALLKIVVPDAWSAAQVRLLQVAAGRGFVRLIAHDPQRRAVLLEALGPSLDRSGRSPEAQLRTLAALLRRAREVLPCTGPDAGTARDKASELQALVSRLWEELGRPCSEDVVALALDCARRRAAAFDPDRCVLVHGDAAAPNAAAVLRARPGAEEGCVLIDPEPFLGDPVYDLGVALRDWCPQLLAGDAPVLVRRYAAVLADASGSDRSAIWEWGFLERVSTGLYALSLGAEDVARPLLLTATAICRGPEDHRGPPPGRVRR